ncbi:MAG: hypothetical protein WCP03_01855 [Candidatus Saccharibacteria bacterium]
MSNITDLSLLFYTKNKKLAFLGESFYIGRLPSYTGLGQKSIDAQDSFIACRS